ncbi:fluoride efflux transporter CrcB [Micromonospora sp. NPDC000207]|uniref:fluoride efflux transporter CrcB n=1 Tax=Micromonospora sp. NPDC000207 TaxID=3154246 RepID=UPI0033303104
MTMLLVLLGSAVGAPLRYLTDRMIQARLGSVFPWGTLTVNVTGSLLLGFLIGLPADPAVAALVGTGFCGTLTTYSTFGYETLRLAQNGAWFQAAVHIVVSIGAGLGAVYVGVSLAAAVV